MAGTDDTILAIQTLKARIAAIDAAPVTVIVGDYRIDAGSDLERSRATITMSVETLKQIISGIADTSTEYLRGNISIDGDLGAALMLQKALIKDPTEAIVDLAVDSTGMRNPNLDFIDNVGFLAADLDAARAAFVRIGFRLSALGRHTLEHPPGVFTPWGTGNYCAMLENGAFLELIGHVDQGKPAGLYANQLKRFGAHWGKTSIRVKSTVDETSRLRACGYGVGDPPTFYRHAAGIDFKKNETPAAQSSLVSYPTSLEDGTMLIGMAFLNDTFSDKPGSIEQPNGAVGIEFVMMASHDPVETGVRYARALSAPFEECGYGARIKLARRTELRFASLATLPPNLSSALRDRSIGMAACGIRVRDIAETNRYLASNGIDTLEHAFGLLVAEPMPRAGAIFFVQA
jgi:hypothetical protein